MTSKRIILLIVAGIIAVIMIAGNVLAAYFGEIITEFFEGREWDYSNLDLLAGDNLAQEIESEGIVLIKNEKTLPLSVAPMPTDKENETKMDEAWQKTKVAVFGWGATDSGFVMGGSGSGSSTDRGSGDYKSFFTGLSEGGFEVYQPLAEMMTNYHGARSGAPRHQNPKYPFFNLYEPSLALYQEHIDGAKAFSDTAIVVISRLGGEGGDLELEQSKWNGSGNDNNTTIDNSRTYLDISTDEQAMLDLVTANFGTVVVVINTCNAMKLDFIEVPQVDAAILIGATGQSGSLAVADVLRGKKTVRETVKIVNSEGEEEDLIERDEQGNPVVDPKTNQNIKVYKRSEYPFSPSGKTVDTYIRDFKADPTYVNAGVAGVASYTNGGTYVDYVEDIYYGYFYYETAHKLKLEGKYDSFDYDSVVQFPFGYGMSYTNFEWEVTNVSPNRGSILDKDGVIEIGVAVTNKGEVPGKEVVQAYFTAPYTAGGIEKPFVKLCAYDKTELLQPGETQTLFLEFNVSDMASYDCYDKNDNSFAGYELDGGSYEIKLQTNAHTLADTKNGEATIKYTIPAIGYKYDEDVEIETQVLDSDKKVTEKVVKKTLKAAQNLFTGENAYSGVSIDGKNSNANIVFMTREDFTSTFPKAKASRRAKASMPAFNDGYGKDAVIEGDVPTQGSTETSHMLYFDSDLSKPNHDLMMQLGSDYNDPLWDELLNQIPLTGAVTGSPGNASTGGSLETIVGRGGWRTSYVASIGKPWNVDLDGPSGLNSSVASGADTSWTSFPVSTVLAQTWNDNMSYMYGLAVAAEAKATGVSGWYAPAMNMHRSPFMGRNFEYYSEDPLISGQISAETCRGALTNGLYPYIKHFAVNDCETNRTAIYTWLTEQNLREMYLRPFEIAVKKGYANGVMSSFNRLGAIWTGGNKALLTDVLRGEWGFQGSVITDWTTGGSFMNVDQGLRAGNDLWLTGQQSMPGGWSDKTSDTAKIAMRQSAKNQLFMLTNTYYYSQITEGEVLVPIPPPPLGFGWWTIWGLLPFNIIFGCGLLICVFFAFPQIGKIFKKKSTTTDVV